MRNYHWFRVEQQVWIAVHLVSYSSIQITYQVITQLPSVSVTIDSYHSLGFLIESQFN
jgi:hypothetical protein